MNCSLEVSRLEKLKLLVNACIFMALTISQEVLSFMRSQDVSSLGVDNDDC